MTTVELERAGAIDWVERAALAGSFACMVHCLALPLLIAALPALSRFLAIPESFHLWVLALAAPAATIALMQGRARHHAIYPLLLGGYGLFLLAIGATVLGQGSAETTTTVAGSILLAIAHVINWRLRHACHH